MRAFFAVDVPSELSSALDDVRSRLGDAEGLRFIDPEQAHITLEFLGDVPDDGIDEVIVAGEGAVAAADIGPFDVHLEGLGVFPSLAYISVVWIGITEGTTQLGRLHAELSDRTTVLGYEPDDREFTPHVTVARMSDARGKPMVQEAVRDWQPTIGSFTARDLRLKRSRLTDSGPAYSTIESFRLSP